MRNPTRATLTGHNFQSLHELGKSYEVYPKAHFKNFPNFESKDELKKAISKFEFHM